jgi:hypothetical protein
MKRKEASKRSWGQDLLTRKGGGRKVKGSAWLQWSQMSQSS